MNLRKLLRSRNYAKRISKAFSVFNGIKADLMEANEEMNDSKLKNETKIKKLESKLRSLITGKIATK